LPGGHVSEHRTFGVTTAPADGIASMPTTRWLGVARPRSRPQRPRDWSHVLVPAGGSVRCHRGSPPLDYGTMINAMRRGVDFVVDGSPDAFPAASTFPDANEVRRPSRRGLR
jgi:hypothetical protein